MDNDGRLDELLVELVSELADDGAAVRTESLERFAEPARGNGGRVMAVLLPDSVAQVRTMIGWARRHRIRLNPQGANSGLVGASTPGPSNELLILSTDRLRSDPEIDAVNRTAVVSAGVRLSELNAALATHGLELPIDLGADPSLGGMAATNTGGARMIRHGDMRSHVLGLEVVTADNEVSVIDELTTLRKNNTGLGLSHLFVGSGGALGVITQVSVAVEPRPTARACAWMRPAGADEAISALLSLERTAESPMSAFEVVSGNAMNAATANLASARNPFTDAADRASADPDLYAMVEFEQRGPPCGAESEARLEYTLAESLGKLADERLIIDAVIVPPDDAWSLRHSISEGLRRTGTIIGFDVSAPRTLLPALVSEVRSVVADLLPRATVADFGHWGDGGVHCSVIVPFDEPLTEAEHAALRDVVFDLVVNQFRGSFSAEHGIGPVNADRWRDSTSPGSKSLSHALKAACDPLGILGHPGMPY